MLTDMCKRPGLAGVELQQWDRVVPDRRVKERTGLTGSMYKNVKFDLCLDLSKVKTRGLIVMRCDTDSAEQRMRFSYNAPLQ